MVLSLWAALAILFVWAHFKELKTHFLDLIDFAICTKGKWPQWWLSYCILSCLAVSNPKKTGTTMNETFLGLLYPTEDYKVWVSGYLYEYCVVVSSLQPWDFLSSQVWVFDQYKSEVSIGNHRSRCTGCRCQKCKQYNFLFNLSTLLSVVCMGSVITHFSHI